MAGTILLLREEVIMSEEIYAGMHVESYKIISYIVTCDKCNFNIRATICNTPSDIREAAKKHIRETGHHVEIEKTCVTNYSFVE